MARALRMAIRGVGCLHVRGRRPRGGTGPDQLGAATTGHRGGWLGSGDHDGLGTPRVNICRTRDGTGLQGLVYSPQSLQGTQVFPEQCP